MLANVHTTFQPEAVTQRRDYKSGIYRYTKLLLKIQVKCLILSTTSFMIKAISLLPELYGQQWIWDGYYACCCIYSLSSILYTYGLQYFIRG